MMVDFEAIVGHFWPKALRAIHEYDDYEVKNDREALCALNDTEYKREGSLKKRSVHRTDTLCDKNLSDRVECLVKWFESYAVFLGVTAAERVRIAEAVLRWTDRDKERNPSRDLTTAKALADAHAELMEVVCQAYGKNHDFTSLASKALWLCYPNSVPIYDRNARNALHVIGKIEDGITTISEKSPKYAQFVHVWKQLYERHKGTIENLDIGTYPYRVRVFDRVLWLIGQPTYRVD
jgi:hypothetical protein